MRKLSIKDVFIIFLTQIIPWLLLATIYWIKPLSLVEYIGPYINNVPAAFVISISLGVLISLIILLDAFVTKIILKTVEISRIKTNFIASSIHILTVCLFILGMVGPEDL